MKLLRRTLTFLLPLIFGIACAPVTVDDFFGIAMKPENAEAFQIVSYSAAEGVQYRSSPEMNTAIYAYAEFRENYLLIKITNMDTYPLQLSFDRDEYVIKTTENEEYKLLKGDPFKYASVGNISPKKSVELNLELPSNFWATVGMKNPQAQTAAYTEDFWKGENSLNLAREEVDNITLTLGGNTILLLKPIP